jgi:uncharacterized protein YdeI (YjbR/CyaY-like superfamily)
MWGCHHAKPCFFAQSLLIYGMAIPSAPVKEFYARTRKAWRQWLLKNYDKEASVWLIIYRKESATPSVKYDEAVEEALCFGWIDSKPAKRDAESYLQYFARRKPKSNWSALNKTRVAQLLATGLIHPSGMAMIELAKKTGTWTALEAADALEYPPDLIKAFVAAARASGSGKAARTNFDAFPKSVKRAILEWIGNAKQPATRAKRIEETVSKAAQNIRANQWRQ